MLARGIRRHGCSRLCHIRYQSVLSVDKKTLRKYLYDARINLSYDQVISAYEACAKDAALPKGVASSDLMDLKKVLEKHRKRTGKLERKHTELERQLVERAAEMGNNVAVSVLCYMTLTDKQSSQDDQQHANKLLKALVDQEYGPALKVSGDLAYGLGYPEPALVFYNRALVTTVGSLDLDSRSSCLRAAGLLSFQYRKFVVAKDYLERAIDSASDPSQVYECHYYLSQLFEEDKQRSRYHLEQAARFGLKESFAKLGFLLFHYFNDVEHAKDWYQLGTEIGDLPCMVGLFDLYVKVGDVQEAVAILEALKKRDDAAEVINQRASVIASLKPTDMSSPVGSFEDRFR